MRLFGVLIAIGIWWSTVGAQVEPEQRLDLRATRFYRESNGQTVFDVFGRVSLDMFDRPGSGDTNAISAYRVVVSVKDSTGLELLSQSWVQVVPELSAAAERASAVEHIRFAADPGEYVIEFMVTDSATGRVSRQQLEVRAFHGTPVTSDVLLGTRIRPVHEDSAARPGEVRKGAVYVEASGRPVLTPQQAQLGYYMELYRAQPETVSVRRHVQALTGPLRADFGEERIALTDGGGAMRGTIDLSGLPPGDYRLVISVRVRDTTLTRTAEFGMAGFETEAAILPRANEPDVFSGMSEAQLDTVYLPLVYLMTREEQGQYESLSVRGKREYLRLFWSRRDPTSGTARNEAQEDFYSRIAEANRRFGEGGAGQIPGWRTDRGRIFIKHGAPDEILQRPQAGNTNPYEVWKYTRGRALKYVFLDVTQFGNYALIYTSDRHEATRPNWEALLGPEAVIDVQRF